ncbi:tyrosine-type recombinase/integrase [Paenibacillus elgii]
MLEKTATSSAPSFSEFSNFEPNWAMFLEDGKYLSFAKLKNQDQDPALTDLSFIYFFLFKNTIRKSEALTGSSLKIYKQAIFEFLDFIYGRSHSAAGLPPCSLAEVGFIQLEGYQKFIKGKMDASEYAPATARRKITIIRALLKYGVEFQFFDRDLSVYLRPPKLRMIRQERKLIKKEMALILEELRKKPMNRLIGAFLLMMGLRISELCFAKWGDLYEGNNGQIFMKVIGKGNKERHLRIDLTVFQLLLRYRSERGDCIIIGKEPDQWLITNSKRNQLNDRVVRKMIERAAVRAGVSKQISPHWFRHSAASYSLLGGANIIKVKDWLGHADIRTTQIYLHDIERENDTGPGEYMKDIFV